MTPEQNKVFVRNIKKLVSSANAVIASQKDITTVRTAVLKSKLNALQDAVNNLTNVK